MFTHEETEAQIAVTYPGTETQTAISALLPPNTLKKLRGLNDRMNGWTGGDVGRHTIDGALTLEPGNRAQPVLCVSVCVSVFLSRRRICLIEKYFLLNLFVASFSFSRTLFHRPRQDFGCPSCPPT